MGWVLSYSYSDKSTRVSTWHKHNEQRDFYPFECQATLVMQGLVDVGIMGCCDM
jgi:hypothetical protein